MDALGGFSGQQDVLFSGKITLEERQKHTVNEHIHVKRMNMKKKKDIDNYRMETETEVIDKEGK